MNPFAQLSEALLHLGSALDSQAIPRVTFQVVHQPTDHPSLGNPWGVTAIVTGTTGVPNEETLPSVAYEHRFSAEGLSFEEAHQAVRDRLREGLEALHSDRQSEAAFAEQGLKAILRTTQNISEIWQSQDNVPTASSEGPSPTPGQSADWETVERVARES